MAGSGEAFGRSPNAILVLCAKKVAAFSRARAKSQKLVRLVHRSIGPTMRQSSGLPLLPSLVSLLRVPLAAVFPLCIERPALALAVLLAAGASDVLDGWIARRFNQATPAGAVIDPISDKLFVGVVAITLLATDRLSPFQMVLLASREIIEFPLLLWWIFSPRHRNGRARNPTANLPGKFATVVQFAAVGSAVLGSSATGALVFAAALSGGLAGAAYWRRELRREPAGV
jgi:cardiolipin synthase (CMP-forming)